MSNPPSPEEPSSGENGGNDGADSGFAPSDLTDGRTIGSFKTRYKDPIAKKAIRVEAGYLAFVLASAPILVLIAYSRIFHVGLTDSQYEVVTHYIYAWLGGMLGGALFSIKWLYHSVAHGSWNQDRRLWRLFTPHISAGLAFAVIVLMESAILGVFNPNAVEDPKATIGIAFLVGYFSDSVVAKLAEVAKNIFGDMRSARRDR